MAEGHDHEGRLARLGFCSVCEAARVAERVGGPQLVEQPVTHQFDLFGELTGQVAAVFEVMRDGRWHTMRQIAGQLSIPEQSVSARIRDLRKTEFGSHTIVSERLPGRQGFRYRIVR